jgi:hypothetical protein
MKRFLENLPPEQRICVTLISQVNRSKTGFDDPLTSKPFFEDDVEEGDAGNGSAVIAVAQAPALAQKELVEKRLMRLIGSKDWAGDEDVIRRNRPDFVAPLWSSLAGALPDAGIPSRLEPALPEVSGEINNYVDASLRALVDAVVKRRLEQLVEEELRIAATQVERAEAGERRKIVQAKDDVVVAEAGLSHWIPDHVHKRARKRLKKVE